MNRIKNHTGLGAAILSGALTMGACAPIANPARSAQQDKLFAERGPTQIPEKETKCSPKKYLDPPQTPADITDLLLICQATRAGAQAFITLQQQITSTKGCRVMQAIKDQGDRIFEACMPVISIPVPPGSDMGKVISVIRLGLVEVQEGLNEMQKLNPQCFNSDQIAPEITVPPRGVPLKPKPKNSPNTASRSVSKN